MTYPNSYDQVMFGTVKEAWNMGAVAVGATIYFGSEQSRRQLVEIAEAFDRTSQSFGSYYQGRYCKTEITGQ